MSEMEKDEKKEQVLEKIDLINLLENYLSVLKYMIPMLIIFTAAFAGAFYLKGRITYSPRYTASATYTVNIQELSEEGTRTSIRYYDNEVAMQIVNTFPYILTSEVLKNRVAEELGTPVVTASIQAKVAENTNFLTVSATDSDPEVAYQTLQAVLKHYPDISELIIGRVYLELLDETGIPEEPVNPLNLKRTTVKGGLLGCLVVLIWCAIRTLLKQTIRREKDIIKHLHVRCMSVIPTIIGQKRRRQDEEAGTTFLNSKFEEQLREPFMQLRNRVQYYGNKYNIKTFMITSALAGEGKSTIAVNLALALMEDHKKVVLIDCDVRHPSDRKVLGLEDGKGLSEILLGEASIGECLLTPEKMGLPADLKMVFLPGGKRIDEGAEFLGSKRMKMIIHQLAEHADYVILDSAPASLLTDAVVLAQNAEAAIIVARKDFANVDHILEGMEHLAESNIRIIGAVLNDA